MTQSHHLLSGLDVELHTGSRDGFHGVTDSTSHDGVCRGPHLPKYETYPDFPAKSLQILVLSVTRSLIRLQVCARSAMSGFAG